MEGLLRFILIVLLIYFSLRLIGRYLLPFLLKRFMRRMSGRFFNQRFHSDKKDKEEGEITVQYSDSNTKKVHSDAGEYIDYEEIKKGG